MTISCFFFSVTSLQISLKSVLLNQWLTVFLYEQIFVNEFLIVFGQNRMTRINPWSPETYWCFVRFSFLNFDWRFHNSWLEFDVEDFLSKFFFCLVISRFLTARLRWRGLRNGLFVVVVVVLVLVLVGKLFWIPRKKWTFTALIAGFSRK